MEFMKSHQASQKLNYGSPEGEESEKGQKVSLKKK